MQKIGFVSDDAKLDASKETGSLILVGASNSTIAGGVRMEISGSATLTVAEGAEVCNGNDTIFT